MSAVISVSHVKNASTFAPTTVQFHSSHFGSFCEKCIHHDVGQ